MDKQSKTIFILFTIIFFIISINYLLLINVGDGGLLYDGVEIILDAEEEEVDERDINGNFKENIYSYRDYVFISPKKVNEPIKVDFIVLNTPGFVVAFENSFDGPVGGILGVTKYLKIGEHTEVVLDISREVEAGEVFDVVLAEDNGDEVFSLVDDNLIKINGNVVYSVLKIHPIIE